MGAGASVGLSAAVQSASADDLKAVLSSMSEESRKKLRNTLEKHAVAKLGSQEIEVSSFSHALSSDVLRYDGFREHAYRLAFHWGAKFQNGQQDGPWRLKTVLPTGDIENDKDLKPNSEGGLVSFTYHQSINAANVGELAQTPFVWQRPDGSYAVVQTWKVSINEEFQKSFTISSENPNEGKFGLQPAEEFKMALAGLFGDVVVKELGIKYCHKVTQNTKPALVGSSEKLMEFIKSNATIRQELDLLEVGKDANADEPLSFVGRGVDGKGKEFSKAFTMSPNTMYVVYVKQGWETMACVKPLHQFEKECEFTTPPKQCSL